MDKWKRFWEEISQYTSLRKGQMLMCALYKTDMPLAEKITGTIWDCFYDDSKCEAFIEKLKEEWGSEAI
jgi:hypothetical protein